MRWRDIRFEKPTDADGDAVHGEVLIDCKNGKRRARNWEDVIDSDDVIAWMPMSELPAFERIPDPPEGWRFVVQGEAFDKRAKFWNETYNDWYVTQQLDNYDPELVYIVPIDPPAPQYRPFANAAEFEPHAARLWRFSCDANDARRQPKDFNDRAHGGKSWEYCLSNKVFTDGTPFGVRVDQ